MNKELNQNLKAAFEANKGCEVMHVTSDGQIFTNPESANVHQNCINRDNHTNGSVSTVTAKSLDEAEPAKKTAEERVADIEAASTLEELEALIVDEKAKTVTAAYEKRKSELTEAAKGESAGADTK